MTLYFSSVQNNVTTIMSILSEMSARRANIGSKEFLTPLTSKWAKYLLLSRNRFRVCWGDSLKFFDIEITKNYKMFSESRKCFFCTSVISTLRGCDCWVPYCCSFCCNLNKNSRALRTGAGYIFRILLFYAYSIVWPNFLSISHTIFQLYSRIAGVEFYLMASNFSKVVESGCSFIIDLISTPIYTPS